MPEEPAQKPSIAAFRIAATLAVDAAIAEVTGSLAAADVPSVVLKGPSLAGWLYSDGTPRSYDDGDLLVAPADAAKAAEVLRNLGFGGGVDEMPWVRGGQKIDLHTTLESAGAAPDHVWAVLSRRTQEASVGGAAVRFLDEPARAMHVALHAAQHGAAIGKPLIDLRRATAQAPLATWRSALELARELEAEAPFAAGLRLDSGGAGIADQLGATTELPLAVRLAAASPARGAWGIEHLRTAPGLRGKAAFLARRLVPAPEYLRAESRLAHRGRLGLALAYFSRPFVLARRAVPALRAWVQAWHESGRR